MFARGDSSAVSARIPSINEEKFLEEISPSFGQGLGVKNPLKMVLTYTDIDLRGEFTFRKGLHEITLESNKTNGEKILIINETI